MQLVRVHFLKSDVGALNGLHVRRFKLGEEAEISEDLAIQFLHRGSIVILDKNEDYKETIAQVVQPQNNQKSKPFFRGKRS
jgi:hypothetical protein